MKAKYFSTAVLALLLSSANLFSQDDGVIVISGPNTPGTTENQPLALCAPCSGAIWNNTSNVSSQDGIYSDVLLQNHLNCFQSSCFRSRYLTCYKFGFSILANAVVEGVRLNMIGSADIPAAVLDCTIVLGYDNLSPSGTNMASPLSWPTSDSNRAYGGPGQSWGLTLTPADINSPLFSAFIKVYNISALTPTVSVDAVALTVYYTLPSALGVFSQTQSPQTLSVYTDYSSSALSVVFSSPPDGSKAAICLYNANGQKCFSSEFAVSPGTVSEQRISTANLQPGIYLCTVLTGSRVYSAKAVVAK